MAGMYDSFKSAHEDLVTFNNSLQSIQGIAQDANQTVQEITRVYQTCKDIDHDIACIEAKTTVELAQIASKFHLAQTVLANVFGERQTALVEHYKVLDNAILENDRNMVIQALTSISGIVASSPLSDITKFFEVYDNPDKVLELDF